MPIWKEKTITINVPICPRCGNEMEIETDPDARTLYHYKCNKCRYLE